MYFREVHPPGEEKHQKSGKTKVKENEVVKYGPISRMKK